MVELRCELMSAAVKGGLHKHFKGEENFLVELDWQVAVTRV